MFAGTHLRPPTAVRRRAYTTAARRPILATALLVPRYDPLFDIEGAFFPSWMLCVLIGIAAAVVLRLLFARVGLEPHLGPLAVVYPCLALLLSMSVWLLFFRV
jgi:YtcA-like protein